MDCGIRELSLNLPIVSLNSTTSAMTPRTRANKLDQDIITLFLDWKSKLTPSEEVKYKTASCIKFIKLESFETGIFKFNSESENTFAFGRLPIEDAKALVACNPHNKHEWDDLVSRAFTSLSKYFEGDQLLNCFDNGEPFCDRLVRNYANPDAAMLKLITTCKVRDLFVTQSNIVCVHMDVKENMRPELIAKCIFTDVEYSAFECERLLTEFNEICHFFTKTQVPPYETIGILVRANPEKAKELVAAIISKFRDPNSQIKAVLNERYRGWAILPAIIKYFEDASALKSTVIEAVSCDLKSVP